MNPVCPKCNCTANQIGPEHYECPYCGKKFTAKIVMPNGNPMSDNQQPKPEQSQSNFTLSNSTSSNWWHEVKNFDPETTINKIGESKFLSCGIAATILLVIMNFTDFTDSSTKFVMQMDVLIIFLSAIVLWCSIKVVRYGKFKVLAITNIILAALLILGVIHELLLVFSDDYYYWFMNNI